MLYCINLNKKYYLPFDYTFGQNIYTVTKQDKMNYSFSFYSAVQNNILQPLPAQTKFLLSSPKNMVSTRKNVLFAFFLFCFVHHALTVLTGNLLFYLYDLFQLINIYREYSIPQYSNKNASIQYSIIYVSTVFLNVSHIF